MTHLQATFVELALHDDEGMTSAYFRDDAHNSFALARYADDQDDGLVEVHLGDERAETVPVEVRLGPTSLALDFDAVAAAKLGTDGVTIGFDAAACDAAELQAVIADLTRR